MKLTMGIIRHSKWRILAHIKQYFGHEVAKGVEKDLSHIPDGKDLSWMINQLRSCPESFDDFDFFARKIEAFEFLNNAPTRLFF